MTNFKKGDRVRVVEVADYAAKCGIQVGDEGTVIKEGDNIIGVRMDKHNEELHTCDGHCKNGHGWWFDQDQLELIENETPEPLENWKHPWYGKKILVRDYEDEEWVERSFVTYIEGYHWPIIISDENGKAGSYKYYKFPDPSPEVPEYTMDELTKKLGHEFKIKSR